MKHYYKRGMDLKKQEDLYPKSVLYPLVIPPPHFTLFPFLHLESTESPNTGLEVAGVPGLAGGKALREDLGCEHREAQGRGEGQHPGRRGAQESPGPALQQEPGGRSRRAICLGHPGQTHHRPTAWAAVSTRLGHTGHKGCDKPN